MAALRCRLTWCACYRSFEIGDCVVSSAAVISLPPPLARPRRLAACCVLRALCCGRVAPPQAHGWSPHLTVVFCVVCAWACGCASQPHLFSTPEVPSSPAPSPAKADQVAASAVVDTPSGSTGTSDGGVRGSRLLLDAFTVRGLGLWPGCVVQVRRRHR